MLFRISAHDYDGLETEFRMYFYNFLRHSFVEMSLVNIYQALPGKLHGQRSLVGYSP